MASELPVMVAYASHASTQRASAAASASQARLRRVFHSASNLFERRSFLAEEADVATTVANDTTFDATPASSAPAVPSTFGRPSLLARAIDALSGHLDAALLVFLGYKLALLVLYTMPIEYGFGVKRHFLKWASRAAVFRMYLRLVPIGSLSLIMASSLAVRFSTRPPAPGTVQRWRALALLNTVLTYCTIWLFELIRGDPNPLIDVEVSAQDRDLLAVEPPPLAAISAATWAYRKVCPTVFLGLEVIPSERRRILFVGNHVIWGLDVPLLLHGLYKHTGIWARPLGEHSWFSVPVVCEILKYGGGVDGTRHNCDLLMAKGENILVYPGGARESWKRTTDDKYAIIWGDHHLGFVSMAVRHGYTIVPVATVGTEDVFHPLVDLPLERILSFGGLIATPPRGTSKAFEEGSKLPLVVPQPIQAQRVYYRFMPPIRTGDMCGKEDDQELLRSLRDKTKEELLVGIRELMEYRASDPKRFVFGAAKTGGGGNGVASGHGPDEDVQRRARL